MIFLASWGEKLLDIVGNFKNSDVIKFYSLWLMICFFGLNLFASHHCNRLSYTSFPCPRPSPNFWYILYINLKWEIARQKKKHSSWDTLYADNNIIYNFSCLIAGLDGTIFSYSSGAFLSNSVLFVPYFQISWANVEL